MDETTRKLGVTLKFVKRKGRKIKDIKILRG
jgi:hypothetical protein